MIGHIAPRPSSLYNGANASRLNTSCTSSPHQPIRVVQRQYCLPYLRHLCRNPLQPAILLWRHCYTSSPAVMLCLGSSRTFYLSSLFQLNLPLRALRGSRVFHCALLWWPKSAVWKPRVHQRARFGSRRHRPDHWAGQDERQISETCYNSPQGMFGQRAPEGTARLYPVCLAQS